MRWRSALLALLLCGTAHAEPTCWPGLTANGLSGTFPTIGESDTHRWAWWDCKDSTGKVTERAFIVGVKSIDVMTLLGRMLTIEKATTANRPSVFHLMWLAYVTTPLTDASLADGVTQMKATW